MSLIPPSPDAQGIATDGVDAIGAEQHALALHLMQQSPLADALASLQAIRTALLADNPRALRKRVGWFGRLIGNDVTMHAQAAALRERLGVLLIDAQAQCARLPDYLTQLAHAQSALEDAINALESAQTRLPAMHDVASEPINPQACNASQLGAQWANMAAMYRITQGQLQLLTHNAQRLRERYAWLLPRLGELLLQERALQAGNAQNSAMAQAVAMIDDLSVPSDSATHIASHDPNPRTLP